MLPFGSHRLCLWVGPRRARACVRASPGLETFPAALLNHGGSPWFPTTSRPGPNPGRTAGRWRPTCPRFPAGHWVRRFWGVGWCRPGGVGRDSPAKVTISIFGVGYPRPTSSRSIEMCWIAILWLL